MTTKPPPPPNYLVPSFYHGLWVGVYIYTHTHMEWFESSATSSRDGTDIKVKVKLSLCLINYAVCHEWRHMGEWRWVVSFTPQPFYHQGNSPQYPFDRRLCGPQIQSGHWGEEKHFPLPEITLRPIAQFCIDWALLEIVIFNQLIQPTAQEDFTT
jgi:hypothetical protein